MYIKEIELANLIDVSVLMEKLSNFLSTYPIFSAQAFFSSLLCFQYGFGDIALYQLQILSKPSNGLLFEYRASSGWAMRLSNL